MAQKYGFDPEINERADELGRSMTSDLIQQYNEELAKPDWQVKREMYLEKIDGLVNNLDTDEAAQPYADQIEQEFLKEHFPQLPVAKSFLSNAISPDRTPLSGRAKLSRLRELWNDPSKLVTSEDAELSQMLNTGREDEAYARAVELGRAEALPDFDATRAAIQAEWDAERKAAASAPGTIGGSQDLRQMLRDISGITDEMVTERMGSKKKESYAALRDEVSKRTFMATWAQVAPSLPALCNDLIRRAAERGQYGLQGISGLESDLNLYERVTLAAGDYEAILDKSRERDYQELAKYTDFEIYKTYVDQYAKGGDKRLEALMSYMLTAARGDVIQETSIVSDVFGAFYNSTSRMMKDTADFAIGMGMLQATAGQRIMNWARGREQHTWLDKMEEEIAYDAYASTVIGASVADLGPSEQGHIAKAVTGFAEQIPIWIALASGKAPIFKMGKTAYSSGSAFLAVGYAGGTQRELLAQGVPLPIATAVGGISGGLQSAVETIQFKTATAELGLTPAKLRVAYQKGISEAFKVFGKSFVEGIPGVGKDVLKENIEEGTQEAIDTICKDLALGKEAREILTDTMNAFMEDFTGSTHTMVASVLVGRTGRGLQVIKQTVGELDAQAAAKIILDSPFKGIENMTASAQDVKARADRRAELQQQWREKGSDAEREAFLSGKDTGLSRGEAESLHKYFTAIEEIQTRHKGVAARATLHYLLTGDPNYEDLAVASTTARGKAMNVADAAVETFKAMGFNDVSAADAADGNGFVITLGSPNGNGLSFQIVPSKHGIDASAGAAVSAYGAIVDAICTEATESTYGTLEAFVERWQTDDAFRAKTIADHKLESKGDFITNSSGAVLVKDSEGNTSTIDIEGVIELVYGTASNVTVAHETVHGIYQAVRKIIQTAPNRESEIVKWAEQLESGLVQLQEHAARLTGRKLQIKEGEVLDEEYLADVFQRGTAVAWKNLDAEAGKALKRNYEESVLSFRRMARMVLDWFLATPDYVETNSQGEAVYNNPFLRDRDIAAVGGGLGAMNWFNNLYAKLSKADATTRANKTVEAARQGKAINRKAATRQIEALKQELAQLPEDSEDRAAIEQAIADYTEAEFLGLEREATQPGASIDVRRDYGKRMIRREYERDKASAETPAQKKAARNKRDRQLRKLERRLKSEGAQAEGASSAQEGAQDKKYSITADSGYAREYAEVEAQYRNTDQWMKAPNGKPTLLTERQWVQVRTPSFKAWFGDWEANALLLAIEQLPSIDVVDREGNIDAVVAYTRLKESRNEIDGRTIRFVNSALGKILRHKGYPAERIVHQLGEIYEKAVPIGFVPEEKREGHKEHRNFVGYHNYVGKIADAGKTYYVRITVQELKTKSKTFNPNEFHSSFISDVELYNETDALALNTAKSAGKVGAVGFVDNIIAKLISKNNNVSKIVDRNGEPRVVYHGTPSKPFFEFSTEGEGASEGSGAWFSSTYSGAETYAENQEFVLFPNDINESLVRKNVGISEGFGFMAEATKKGYSSDWKGKFATDFDEETNMFVYDPHAKPLWYDTREEVDEDFEDIEENITPAYKTDENDFYLYRSVEELVEAERSENYDAYIENGGGIYACFLNIRNPEVIDAKGEGWDRVPVGYEVDGMDFSTKEEAEAYAEENGIDVDEIETITTATNDIAIESRSAGFSDGVIILDVEDTGGFSRIPYSYQDDFIAFSPNQIKSATDNIGTFSRERNDIRFSITAPVERRKDLIGLHNMSAEGLKGADDLGGLAMPSIAITKDSIPHDEFGPISLLMKTSSYDPSRKDNEIYSHDAWTPTFPHIDKKVDTDNVQRVSERLIATLPAELQSTFNYSDRSRLVYPEEISDNFKYNDAPGEAFGSSEVLKAAYLISKGETVKPVTKPKSYLSGRGAPRIGLLGEDGLRMLYERDGERLMNLSYKEAESAWPLIAEIGNEAMYQRDLAAHPELSKYTKEQVVQGFFDEAHKFNLNEINAIIDALRDLDRDIKAGTANDVEYDVYKTRDAINTRVPDRDPAFSAWLNEQYGNPILARGIRNAKGLYTPSGNRRKWDVLHDPVTLQNVVKIMKQTQHAHGGGVIGRNPYGVAVKKFKTLKDVVSDEGILRPLTREEEKAIKAELSEKLSDVVWRYADTNKTHDPNRFTALDNATDVLLEAYLDTKGAFEGLMRELNKWGYSATEDLVRDFMDVMQAISVMPTNYFEAKPMRGVTFDEIAAAIVPDNESQETLDILSRRGVDVYTYKAEDSDDRLRAVNEAADATRVRFSITAEPYNPRAAVPKVRGGWTEAKILRYLKTYHSLSGQVQAAKLIAEFDSPEELKRHMFYHGTGNYVDRLFPSIIKNDAWAERHGGGGYGQRYWGISITKNKKVATNFGGANSRDVSVYPIILAKNAKVIERPDFSDAADIEDHIVDLWTQGVDAVWIGRKDGGEEELCVLNPRAICNVGTADHYRLYNLGGVDNPINIKDDNQIAKIYYAAKDYVENPPNMRFGSGPLKPSRFFRNTDGTLGELKPKEIYDADLAQYEKEIADWNVSEQGRAKQAYMSDFRNTLRFSITAEQDMAYRRAVEEGDMEIAMLLLRQAAAQAMPDTKVVDDDGLPKVVYHGTERFGFTQFKGRVFLASSLGLASEFANNADTREIASALKLPENGWANRADLFKWLDEHGIRYRLFKAYGTTKLTLATDRTSPKDSEYNAYEDTWDVVIPDDENAHVPIKFENPIWSLEFALGQGLGEWSSSRGRRGIYSVLVNIKNPYILDAKGKQYYELRDDNLAPGKDLTAQDVVELALRDPQYDGVIIKNLYEGSGTRKTTDYIPRDVSQIKSADTATYDDNGNLIPLSKRFNPNRDDIRYSISSLYTGSAADYDKPSLHYVGSGEGSQVYGWGLYGSTVRGVAEVYAEEGTAYRSDAVALARHYYRDYGSRSKAYQALFEETRSPSAINYREKMDALWLLSGKAGTAYKNPLGNLYEQTFFTDRAPGDESHLLKWYEPVSGWQKNLLEDALSKNGVTVRRVTTGPDYDRGTYYEKGGKLLVMLRDQDAKLTGELAYQLLSKDEVLGSPKAASEWFAAHDIDGVKYPVDSYGKTVKDGDTVGWNYVSFRDDNIRVDHKWKDGEKLYSITSGSLGAGLNIGHGTMQAVRDFAQGKDAVIENEYGRIVYDFGKPGQIMPSGKIKHGHGLLHIVYSRMAKDGQSLLEAIETAIKVGDAIERGVIQGKQGNKTSFQKDGYEGIVAKNYDGSLVVTGYKIEAGVLGGDKLVPPELRTLPLPRKEDVVAALNDWVKNHPTPPTIPQSGENVKRKNSIAASVRATNEFVAVTKRLAREEAKAKAAEKKKHSISSLYTGSAADYDKPSLHYVGSGEGNQVYGWGLYASSRRGVAESYASQVAEEKRAFYLNDTRLRHKRSGNSFFGDEEVHFERPDGLTDEESYALDVVGQYNGDIEMAKTSFQDSIENHQRLLKEVEEEIANSPDGENTEKNDGLFTEKLGDERKRLLAEVDLETKVLKIFESGAIRKEESVPHIYEQTFFTNRPEGDDSHLLKWYEPLSEEHRRIFDQVLSEYGVAITESENGRAYKDGETLIALIWDASAPITGEEMYAVLSNDHLLGSPKAASEFLARAGIDGVKYPVDSYGKTVKDGNEVGWNYVSFRDDNIRVDHKWKDGERLYSITADMKRNVDNLFVHFDEAKGKSRKEIFEQYDSTLKDVARLPFDMNFPEGLKVKNPVVKCAEAFFLDHAHNHKHEKEYTIEDYKRGFTLISPKNEMRIVPQQGSSSLAFIAKNPTSGWDCVVIAPKRGEFFIYKTMFGQKRKPYQDKPMVRFSISSRTSDSEPSASFYGEPSRQFAISKNTHTIPQSGENVKRKNPIAASVRATNEFVAVTKRLAREEAKAKAAEKKKHSITSAQQVASRELGSYELGTLAISDMLDALIESRARVEGRALSAAEVKEFYNDLGVRLDPLSAGHIANRVTLKVMNAKTRKVHDEPFEEGLADRILEQIYPNAKGLKLGSKAMQLARSQGFAAGVGAAQRVAHDIRTINKIRMEELVAAKGLRTPEFEAEMGFSITRTLMALNDAYGRMSEEERIALDQKRKEWAEKVEDRINQELEAADPLVVFAEDVMTPEDFSRFLELREKLQEAARRTRAELDATAEEKRKAREERRKQQEQRTADEEAEVSDEELEADIDAEEDIMLKNFKSILELTDPNELVWFVQQFCVWKRLGEMKPNADVLKKLTHDPIFVRDCAMTLANIAETLIHGMAYSLNREQLIKKVAEMTEAKSLTSLRTRAIAVFIRIHEARVKESRKDIIAGLRKFLKKKIVDGKAAMKIAKRDIDRKVTAEVEEEARMIRAVLAMSAAKAREKLAEVDAIVAGYDYSRLDTEHNRYRDYRQAVKWQNVLNVYGGARHFSVTQLQQLAENTEKYFEEELAKHTEARLRREEQVKARNETLVNALTEDREGQLEPDKNSPARIKIANWLSSHLGLLDLTMRTIGDQVSKASREAVREILQELTNHFADGEAGERARMIRYKQQLERISTQVYGSMSALAKRHNTVIDESLSRKISMRYTTDAEGNVEKKSIRQRNRLTIGQVLQLKMSIEQEDYTDNAARWHRGAECLAAINSVLTAEDIAWTDAVKQMLNETFIEARDVYKSVTGYTVGTTPNYWPVKIRRSETGAVKTDVRAYSNVTNVMTPRVPHALDFDESYSALQVIIEKLDQQAHMIAFAGHDQAIMDTLCNGDVRRAIRLVLGKDFDVKLQNKIQDVLMGPDIKGDDFSRVLGRASGYFSMCALGFNVMSVLRQTSGWLAVANELGFLDGAKALARSVFDFSSDTQMKWKYLCENDAYNARYNAGFTAGIDDVIRGKNATTSKYIRKVMFDAGLAPLRWMDILFARGVTLHLFDAKVKKYVAQGLSTEEAWKRAATEAWSVIETNQQSSRVANQFESVNRSQWARLLSAMRSGPLQFMQYNQKNLAALLRGEEGAALKLLKGSIATTLSIFADELVNQLMAFLRDDDDELWDEEHIEETVARLVPRLIFGNATAVPLFGETVDMIAAEVGGTWSNATAGQPPVASYVSRTVKELCDAMCAFSPDSDEELAREWFNVVKQFIAPLRLADQIKKGQTGEGFFEE